MDGLVQNHCNSVALPLADLLAALAFMCLHPKNTTS